MSPRSLYRILLLSVVSLAVGLSQLSANLVTVEFSGVFNSTSLLFTQGDTYSGSYTFESSVPTVPHSDSTLDQQAIAIDSTGLSGTVLPGTGWTLSVDSSVVTDFDLIGTRGVIAFGNDTTFGDRYIASLFGEITPLPLGLSLAVFELDLQDHFGAGQDMLNSSTLAEVPNFSLANSGGGRFFILNPPSGCSQCHHSINSFSVVPEPGSLVLIAILGIGTCIRRRSR